MKHTITLCAAVVVGAGAYLLAGAQVTGDTGNGKMTIRAMDNVLELNSSRGKEALILNNKNGSNTASFKATRGGERPGLRIKFTRLGGARGEMRIDPDNARIEFVDNGGNVRVLQAN